MPLGVLAPSILKQQRSPRAALLFQGRHYALASLFAQEVATAAADHQKDRHQGGQQQGGEPLLGAAGDLGRKRLITSNVQRVIRLVGRMRRIMGHPWLRVVNERLTAVCDNKMYPYLLRRSTDRVATTLAAFADGASGMGRVVIRIPI